MAIGMTYDQYWFDDPLMVRAYYKAEKIRQRRMNEEAWLNGAYILRALDATVCNMFRKKGEKPSEYPKEPIGLEEDKKQAEKKRTQSVEDQEEMFARAYMANMVLAGKKWKK